MARLERRIGALEASRPTVGGGVLTMLPGESEADALQRARPGNYLLMPAPMNPADWERMVAEQQAELMKCYRHAKP